MSDHEKAVKTLRSLIDLMSSDTSASGPIPDVLHACDEALALLAGHAAELDRLRFDLSQEEEARAHCALRRDEARRERDEARAENDRLTAFRDEVARQVGLYEAGWNDEMGLTDGEVIPFIASALDSLAAAQEPPAAPRYDTSVRDHPYVRELEDRLKRACDGCAECGHIDWRELDDIIDGEPLTRYSHLFAQEPPAERLGCGHRPDDIVQSSEGTAYCQRCADDATAEGDKGQCRHGIPQGPLDDYGGCTMSSYCAACFFDQCGRWPDRDDVTYTWPAEGDKD